MKVPKGPASTLAKNIIFVFLLFLLLAAASSFFGPSSEEAPAEITVTQLVREINDSRVKEITVTGDELEVVYQDDAKAQTVKETGATLDQALSNYGVDKEKLNQIAIKFEQKVDFWSWAAPLLFTILPLLLFGVFFFMIFRQAKSGAMQTFDFTKARARLFGAEGSPKEQATFKDVAGLQEAKQELEEIVDFLKNPKKYLQMGAKIPHGVLLVGPAGTGKTLLARAVAGESKVPFISIAGSSLVELFVGVGASRIRDLFTMAKKHQPCLIFIDELDSIGKARGPAVAGGHEEREQTLNQMLTEMDGFEPNDKLIVLAATNRPDVLDPALLRPGRFDRKVVLDLPDVNEREAILKIHSRGKPLSSNVVLKEVAERTPGFSGAELANIANEAALLAAKRDKAQIFQNEMLESIEKVLLGPERKSHILSSKEKEITAFHEAGHALVASFLPNSEPVRKISIIARGMAAGYTLKVPSEVKQMKTKSEFLTELAVLLGGRCAEEIKFGEITTGASNDLKEASSLARKMVKDFGMSSLGPISFGQKQESPFLGQDFESCRNYSDQVAYQIDQEIERIIKEAQESARKVLTKEKKMLEKLARALIEKETIEREEFELIISKEKKPSKNRTRMTKSKKTEA
ncbi:MAG: ATP-dependent zinc metalloprotease FtsH [Candidatus Pacebacteria bacterium]|nr:ATP-dependent zinc metalloprotease FtsH [Candidatus Paceibacterota bacterium]MDD4830670.1 ATP-dependent zinc metalloprotease FtsH [Candidatus Paceibacterota bacterium]MDD4875250.1 ATP-dependent zinc metalloprotease FtsH [Candidatus Paceibacterota bacterium]